MVPVAYLHECFDADADAGTLTWKARPLSHFTNIRAARAYRRNVGRLAGRINARGYVIVTLRVDGLYRKFSAHRIVWAMAHGAWPEQEIDHINRDRADNRLFNLRDVSRAVNQGNKAVRPTSPATGVRAHPSGNFSAYIGGSGKQRHLGTFPTVELAVAARVAALSA